MLSRAIAYFLISQLNRSRRTTGSDAPPSAERPSAPPADHALLGDTIPEPPAASANPPRPREKPELIALSPEARRRHLYLLGATGTGKTNLLLRLIESDIQNQRAFCVIDLRGDLVDRILLRLAATAPDNAWRERLLLVDLRHSDHIVGFNPLAGEGDIYHRVLSLLAGGLLVSSFQTAIMSRVDVPEQERVPAHLDIDEFESMASDRFEAIVAEGRRFGLGLTLSHQNISQLSLAAIAFTHW